jgi:hypothetical protein
MENPTQSKLHKIMNVDFSEENSIWLTNTYSLRKLVGILGMLLPVLLYLYLLADSGLTHPLVCISDYFFTRACGIYTIIISLMGIFLIIYKGKEPADFWVSLVAGIFALLTVLFPTSNISDICNDPAKKYSVTILRDSDFRATFHYVTAGVFLLCLAYMAIFIFVKSNKSREQRGSRKILRNRIYRVCGIIMVVSMVIIFAGYLKLIKPEFYNSHNITFWMEAIAVESFGFAWLVKGGTLFKDK